MVRANDDEDTFPSGGSSGLAIDYRALMRRERRRARQEKKERRRLRDGGDADAATSGLPDGPSSMDATSSMVGGMPLNIDGIVTSLSRTAVEEDAALDFCALRREEREKHRFSRAASAVRKQADNSGGGGGGEPPWTLDLGPSINRLTDEEHRVSPAGLDSVRYAPRFLPPEHADAILSWLKTLPGRNATNHNDDDPRKCNGRWTQLKHAKRRVALFDASFPSSGTSDGNGSCYDNDDEHDGGAHSRLPEPMRRIAEALVRVGAFPEDRPPNHVLVNEYRPGEGILPHTDGPSYDSRTATISIGGSDVILRFTPRRRWSQGLGEDAEDQHCDEGKCNEEGSGAVLEVLLHGTGSLVVFTDEMYLGHTHSIDEGLTEEVTGQAGAPCGNDPEGGTVVRRGYRVSLTFRHKKGKGGVED